MNEKGIENLEWFIWFKFPWSPAICMHCRPSSWCDCKPTFGYLMIRVSHVLHGLWLNALIDNTSA